MTFLREGLDKVLLTIRSKHYTQYPYDHDVANKYADRITKLKFSDRYGNVISYDKYPWQTSKYADVERTTYGVNYFLRIDGMRQMRININCQRLYNVFNGLKVYDKRLHDDNVVVPHVRYTLEEFVNIVRRICHEVANDYIELRKVVFGDVITYEDLVIDTHQIEMVQEGIGVHVSDVFSTFREFSRADTITRYYTESGTTYMNTDTKRQLKMYQKGTGLLRVEATFNERPQDLVWNWSDNVTRITESLQKEYQDLLIHMGIPAAWWKPRQMGKKKFVWCLADAINLRTPKKKLEDGTTQPSIVMDEMMLVLLTSSSFGPLKDNHPWTNIMRRFRRKGLVKPSGVRGQYIPTDRLNYLQNIFRSYCELEGWVCE